MKQYISIKNLSKKNYERVILLTSFNVQVPGKDKFTNNEVEIMFSSSKALNVDDLRLLAFFNGFNMNYENINFKTEVEFFKSETKEGRKYYYADIKLNENLGTKRIYLSWQQSIMLTKMFELGYVIPVEFKDVEKSETRELEYSNFINEEGA